MSKEHNALCYCGVCGNLNGERMLECSVCGLFVHDDCRIGTGKWTTNGFRCGPCMFPPCRRGEGHKGCCCLCIEENDFMLRVRPRADSRAWAHVMCMLADGIDRRPQAACSLCRMEDSEDPSMSLYLLVKCSGPQSAKPKQCKVSVHMSCAWKRGWTLSKRPVDQIEGASALDAHTNTDSDHAGLSNEAVAWNACPKSIATASTSDDSSYNRFTVVVTCPACMRSNGCAEGSAVDKKREEYARVKDEADTKVKDAADEAKERTLRLAMDKFEKKNRIKERARVVPSAAVGVKAEGLTGGGAHLSELASEVKGKSIVKKGNDTGNSKNGNNSSVAVDVALGGAGDRTAQLMSKSTVLAKNLAKRKKFYAQVQDVEWDEDVDMSISMPTAISTPPSSPPSSPAATRDDDTNVEQIKQQDGMISFGHNIHVEGTHHLVYLNPRSVIEYTEAWKYGLPNNITFDNGFRPPQWARTKAKMKDDLVDPSVHLSVFAFEPKYAEDAAICREVSNRSNAFNSTLRRAGKGFVFMGMHLPSSPTGIGEGEGDSDERDDDFIASFCKDNGINMEDVPSPAHPGGMYWLLYWDDDIDDDGDSVEIVDDHGRPVTSSAPPVLAVAAMSTGKAAIVSAASMARSNRSGDESEAEDEELNEDGDENDEEEEEEEEFIVERIKAHKPLSARDFDDMKFLVSWLGYDDTEDSWEPYSHLKHLDEMARYISIVWPKGKLSTGLDMKSAVAGSKNDKEAARAHTASTKRKAGAGDVVRDGPMMGTKRRNSATARPTVPSALARHHVTASGRGPAVRPPTSEPSTSTNRSSSSSSSLAHVDTSDSSMSTKSYKALPGNQGVQRFPLDKPLRPTGGSRMVSVRGPQRPTPNPLEPPSGPLGPLEPPSGPLDPLEPPSGPLDPLEPPSGPLDPVSARSLWEPAKQAVPQPVKCVIPQAAKSSSEPPKSTTPQPMKSGAPVAPLQAQSNIKPAIEKPRVEASRADTAVPGPGRGPDSAPVAPVAAPPISVAKKHIEGHNQLHPAKEGRIGVEARSRSTNPSTHSTTGPITKVSSAAQPNVGVSRPTGESGALWRGPDVRSVAPPAPAWHSRSGSGQKIVEEDGEVSELRGADLNVSRGSVPRGGKGDDHGRSDGRGRDALLSERGPDWNRIRDQDRSGPSDRDRHHSLDGDRERDRDRDSDRRRGDSRDRDMNEKNRVGSFERERERDRDRPIDERRDQRRSEVPKDGRGWEGGRPRGASADVGMIGDRKRGRSRSRSPSPARSRYPLQSSSGRLDTGFRPIEHEPSFGTQSRIDSSRSVSSATGDGGRNVAAGYATTGSSSLHSHSSSSWTGSDDRRLHVITGAAPTELGRLPPVVFPEAKTKKCRFCEEYLTLRYFSQEQWFGKGGHNVCKKCEYELEIGRAMEAQPGAFR